MSADELFTAANLLPPEEKWALLTRLWDTFPPEQWPAPSAEELAIAKERMAEIDAGLVETIPGEEVKKWLHEKIRSYGQL